MESLWTPLAERNPSLLVRDDERMKMCRKALEVSWSIESLGKSRGKKTLWACCPLGLCLGTSVVTPFTIIPPRLFHTLSHWSSNCVYDVYRYEGPPRMFHHCFTRICNVALLYIVHVLNQTEESLHLYSLLSLLTKRLGLGSQEQSESQTARHHNLAQIAKGNI